MSRSIRFSKLSVVVFALAIPLSFVCAGTEPAQPAVAAPPAIQPAAQRVPGVLVLPLQIDGDAEQVAKYGWLGEAIRQDLMTEVVRASTLRPVQWRPIVPAGEPRLPAPPADLAGVVAIGRDTGAQIVVFGTVQVVEGEMRVTGQVVDTGTGEPLGSIKATGKMSALFGIEDELSAQLRQLIARDGRFRAADVPPARPPARPESAAPPIVAAPPSIVVVPSRPYVAPPVSAGPRYYPYDPGVYSYPSYSSYPHYDAPYVYFSHHDDHYTPVHHESVGHSVAHSIGHVVGSHLFAHGDSHGGGHGGSHGGGHGHH